MQNKYLSVESVQSIDKAQFIADYYEIGKPVLIKQGTKDWSALAKWSEDYFIEKIGNTKVVLNEFKHTKKKLLRTILPPMRMEEAINIMRNNKDKTKKYYILRDSIVNHYPELLKDIANISLVDSGTFFSRDLWFGDGGNLTPIHFDAADNFVVPIFGEKTFYIYPISETHLIYPHNILTEGRFNFSQVTSRFFVDKKHYPLFMQAKCFRVTVRPGNILYIPAGWWHEVRTHNQRAASITYFFNTCQPPCLLWHFAGYQSCRLHEIKENEVVQELIYLTNYSNYFDKAYELLALKQYWMAVILTGAMLEQLVSITLFQNNHKFLFDVVESYSSSLICDNLLKTENWIQWKQIIKIAIAEDNNALEKYDLPKFIKGIQEFILNNKHLINNDTLKTLTKEIA